MYQRGLFVFEEAEQTARALRWLAAGICSVALLRQTAPVFYALERVKVPVVMGFVFLATYGIAAFSLMGPWGHVGLCMATSIAATAQGLGLVLMLRRQLGNLNLGGVLKAWLKQLLAAAPCAAAAWYVSGWGDWEAGGNAPRNIAVLLLAVVVGGIVYLVAAHLLRLEEYRELLAAVRRRRGGKQ